MSKLDILHPCPHIVCHHGSRRPVEAESHDTLHEAMPSFWCIATKQLSPEPPKRADVSCSVQFWLQTFWIQTLEQDVVIVHSIFERIQCCIVAPLQQSYDNPGQHEALDMFMKLRQHHGQDDRINEEAKCYQSCHDVSSECRNVSMFSSPDAALKKAVRHFACHAARELHTLHETVNVCNRNSACFQLSTNWFEQTIWAKPLQRKKQFGRSPLARNKNKAKQVGEAS